MSDLFNDVPVGEEQNDAMRVVAAKCNDLYDSFMECFSENSRYVSICKTKLEEFSMWANKAIVRDFKPK